MQKWVIVILVALLAGSGLALRSAYKENGRLETALETAGNDLDKVEKANATNATTIEELRTGLASCVADRAADQKENARILGEIRRQLAAANADRAKQRRELDAIYETECGDWGRERVCPGIADRLRDWPPGDRN